MRKWLLCSNIYAPRSFMRLLLALDIAMLRFSFLLATLSLFTYGAFAQQRSIGVWRAHLPYNNAQAIASDGINAYVITDHGFLFYPTNGKSSETFSKVDGMHEAEPVAIAYDAATGSVVIGYNNSNIDLYRHNSFTVLPDLKNKSFAGNKSINAIYADRGIAYLSTGLGVVVIDLDKEEVKETYVFSKGGQTMAIYAVAGDGTYLYAASSGGLYRIARNAPAPQVFANWQAVDTGRVYKKMALAGGAVYAATSGFTDTLYRVSLAGRQRVWYSDSTSILHIDGTETTLYASTFPKNGVGLVYHFSVSGNAIIDSTYASRPNGVVVMEGGSLWLAEGYGGLSRRRSDGSRRTDYFVPNGPNDAESFDIYPYNGTVWVAHGSLKPNYLPANKRVGISRYEAGSDHWDVFHPYNFPLFQDTVADFVCITKDPRSGSLYMGTATGGIYERKEDGSGRIIKQGALLPNLYGEWPAEGLAFDANGALWVTQNYLNPELAVRTADGSWYHYSVPKLNRYTANAAQKIIVDDANQKWYIAPVGGGLIVYNDGGTPETGSDDDVRNLTTGKGQGDLPSAEVRSLVKDRDGAIWIGTDKGIGIAGNPGQMVVDKTIDAEQPIRQYDQFAGLLFSNESVNAMAVDGANRKWVGTNNGIWLLSPDANKIISRYTVDNSPLLSNIIQSIAVDPVTGDVYFGTANGLISYHGTATEGAETAGSIKTFPNPVPNGYTGPIAVRGLTTDADVRITDIAGQLIYRAKATGGQVVWNGLDYTGHRPQSGVLLIFATDKAGTQTAVGKMVLMN